MSNYLCIFRSTDSQQHAAEALTSVMNLTMVNLTMVDLTILNLILKNLTIAGGGFRQSEDHSQVGVGAASRATCWALSPLRLLG